MECLLYYQKTQNFIVKNYHFINCVNKVVELNMYNNITKDVCSRYLICLLYVCNSIIL